MPTDLIRGYFRDLRIFSMKSALRNCVEDAEERITGSSPRRTKIMEQRGTLLILSFFRVPLSWDARDELVTQSVKILPGSVPLR